MFVASVLLPVTVDNASGGDNSNALAVGAGGSGSGGSTALLNLVDFFTFDVFIWLNVSITSVEQAPLLPTKHGLLIKTHGIITMTKV